MKCFYIQGLEGLSDDQGCCEPYAANYEISRRLARGEQLTEENIEWIARRYNCRVVWEG